MGDIKLPSHIAEELGELEARANKLQSLGKRSAVAAGIGAVGCAVAYLVGRSYGPVEVLTSIDLPSAVTGMFSAESGGGLPFQSAAGALSSVLTGGIVKVAAGLGIAMGVIATFIKGDVKYLIGPVMAGGMLLTIPIINTAFGVEAPNDGGGGPRAVLVELADRKDFDGLKKMLAERGVPSLMTNYVLAQAKVVGQDVKTLPDAERGVLKSWVQGLGDGASSGAAAFVKADVLYALESTVGGKPTSKAALAYLEERKDVGRVASGVAGIASMTAAISGVCAVGLLAMGMHMRARVRRIKPLLANAAGEQERAGGSGSRWQDAELGENQRGSGGVGEPGNEAADQHDRPHVKLQAAASVIERDVGRIEHPAPFQPTVKASGGSVVRASASRRAEDETPAGFGFSDVAVMVTAGVVADALLSDSGCSNSDGSQASDSSDCGSDSGGGGD